MKINVASPELQFFLKVLLVQSILAIITNASVLPRPNLKQRTTTQITGIDRGYPAEGTIVIVTSSELPKQIPPPPTPTRPHKPTPKYNLTPSTKKTFYKYGLHDKDAYASFDIPYALNGPNSFHDFT